MICDSDIGGSEYLTEVNLQQTPSAESYISKEYQGHLR